MIYYNHGMYGLGLFFRLKGSVFPKAVILAIPPTIVSVLVRALFPEWADEFSSNDIGRMYNTFIWVLGIVLVFRTSQAYARYWEGAQLLESVYSDFFDACSCIINFSQTSMETPHEIKGFQNTIVRMFSLLHCCALQQTTVREDDSFEVLDMDGIDQAFLDELTDVTGRRQRTEVVGQWILRLVLEAMETGIIPTPPPIVSRIFQEVNTGMVACNRMSTITSTPFPFPYAQLITLLLSLMWLVTPAYISTLSIQPVSAGAFAFLSISVLWSLNLTAAEIEQPFGDDHNDFDIHMTQKEMNRSLLLLLGKQFTALPPLTPRKPSSVKPLKRCFTNSTFKSDPSSQRSSTRKFTTNSKSQSSSTQSLSPTDIGKRADSQSSQHAVENRIKYGVKSESEAGLDKALQQAEKTAKLNESRSDDRKQKDLQESRSDDSKQNAGLGNVHLGVASRSTSLEQAEATAGKSGLGKTEESPTHSAPSFKNIVSDGQKSTSIASLDSQTQMPRSFAPEGVQGSKYTSKKTRSLLSESANEDRVEVQERLQQICSEIHLTRRAVCQLSEHIQKSGSCSFELDWA